MPSSIVLARVYLEPLLHMVLCCVVSVVGTIVPLLMAESISGLAVDVLVELDSYLSGILHRFRH